MRPAARATVWIAAFTVFRGIANFVLQIVVAARFGASEQADAYFVVIAFGLVLSELLVGVLTVAALPMLIQIREVEGDESGWRLERSVLVWCVAALVVASLVLFAGAGPAVRLMAPGFSDDTSQLSVNLLRFSLLGLLAYGCALLLGLALQARNRFRSTAAISVLPFIGSTVGLLALPDDSGLFGLMTGFTAGAVIALFIQVSQWRKVTGRFTLRLSFRHHALAAVAKRTLPVLVASGSVFLLGVFLRMSASELGEGNVAAVGFATQVAAVPVALLTTPVGTVFLSRFSTLLARGDLHAGTRLLNEALLVITLASALVGAILVGLAHPITQLLFERGNFTAYDTALTSDVLRWFGVGLFALSATSLLSRAFAAAGRLHSLAAVWIATLLFFLALWLPSRGTVTVGTLAGIYSAAYVFALVVLLVLLRREGTGMRTFEVVGVCLRLGLSAALAVSASWGVHALTAPLFDSFLNGIQTEIARLAASIAIGSGVFISATFAMRGAEARVARQWMRMVRPIDE